MTKQFSNIELQLYVACVKQDLTKEQATNFFKSMGQKIDFDFLNILRGEYGKKPL